MRLLGRRSLLACALAVGIWLLGCNSPNGGGSDIPPGYVGTLYNEDGSGAANVVVHFIKNEQPPLKSLGKSLLEVRKEITRVTNDKGYIVIDDITLEDGFYSVLGENENGELKSYTDSVLFENGECDTFTDTLKKTGSITGRIKLHYSDHPVEEVSVYFFNTQKQYYLVDKDGMFTISDLAEGSYRVRFDIKYDEYHAFDTVITIRSGVHDTMPESIALTYEIEVTNFSYTMDKLMRSVTLFWDRIDSTKIGGYKLETYDGIQHLSQVILKDTSIIIYLKDYVGARVSTYNLRYDEMNNFTNWIYITAKDIASIKTIALPVDSVRSKGWGLINNQFHIVRTSLYNPREMSISVYEKDGKLVSTRPLAGQVKQPLAVASKGDSLYILGNKNDDTLCIHAITTGDSLVCTDNVNIPSNFGFGANLAFDSAGMIYVSQFRTTYVFSPEGVLIDKKDGLATHFGFSGKGLFTSVDGDSVINKRIVKFELQNNSDLVATDTLVYDKYRLVTNTEKILAANNKGIICCLIELSLFIFNEQESFNARLHIEDAAEVVDLILTDENLLYLLYVTGRIDVIDINEVVSEVTSSKKR